MKYREVSWTEIEKICEDLSQWIRKFHPDLYAIYGIPRGGLIPSVILSHKLNIKVITELSQRTVADIFWERYKILFLDDINDTGETLEKHRGKNRLFATLFGRESSKFLSDYTGEIVEDGVWLVYPWENLKDAEREYKEYMEKRCLT
jgi:hypoxanthine phosphoribosyltransferase